MKCGGVVVSMLDYGSMLDPSGTRIVDFQKGRFRVNSVLNEYTLCILGERKGGEGEEMATALICRAILNVRVLTLYDPAVIIFLAFRPPPDTQLSITPSIFETR